jgi:hypothetical protein
MQHGHVDVGRWAASGAESGRVELGRVLRLLTAVVLLGLALLVVALLGQGVAAARPLTATPQTAGTGGPRAAGQPEGVLPPAGRTAVPALYAAGPAARADLTRSLDAATDVLTPQTPPSSAFATRSPEGPQAPGTPGPGSAQLAANANWGYARQPDELRVADLPVTDGDGTSNGRMPMPEVVAAAGLSERDGGVDPTLPPGTMRVAQHTGTPVTRGLKAGAAGTLRTAYELWELTTEAIERTPPIAGTSTFAIGSNVDPSPDKAPKVLLEPIRQQATVAEFQATTVNREAARSALIGAATGLGRLARWSDEVAGLLNTEEVRRAAQDAYWNVPGVRETGRVPASVVEEARQSWAWKFLPIRELSIKAWNDAARLRRELGDPNAPEQVQPDPEALMGPKPVVPQQATSPKGEQGSPVNPDTRKAATEPTTQPAGAETQHTTPPDHDEAGAAAAPDTTNGGLSQTLPEQTAASTALPTGHSTSTSPPVSSSSPVSSPLDNDVLVTVGVSDQAGADGLGSDTSGEANSFATNLDASVVDSGSLSSSESLSV